MRRSLSFVIASCKVSMRLYLKSFFLSCNRACQNNNGLSVTIATVSCMDISLTLAFSRSACSSRFSLNVCFSSQRVCAFGYITMNSSSEHIVFQIQIARQKPYCCCLAGLLWSPVVWVFPELLCAFSMRLVLLPFDILFVALNKYFLWAQQHKSISVTPNTIKVWRADCYLCWLEPVSRNCRCLPKCDFVCQTDQSVEPVSGWLWN